MKPDGTRQAIVSGADSGAAANKPKRDPDIEAELLRDTFVNYSRQYDFKPGTVVREKAGCSLLRKRGNGPFVLELRDDEPLIDIEARNRTAGFGMPLDMLVGEVDEDDEPTSLWVDHRRFDQCQKKCCTAMTAWLFSLPMTEDRNLGRCENRHWWDNSHEYWDAQLGTTGSARSGRQSLAKPTARAVWSTEDTDWCGSFKRRSDAGSEPDKEEF